MITPLFECDQDEVSVSVRARVPHSRPRDFELSVDGCDFHFYCRPYLLHLRFPNTLLIDHDNAAASYNFETGIAIVKLIKQSPGAHFPHLGCLSALLVSRSQQSIETEHSGSLQPAPPAAAGIEVISSTSHSTVASGNDVEESSHDESGNCCQISSDPANSSPVDAKNEIEEVFQSLSVGRPRYGFAARYEAVFESRAEDVSEILELPDPDTTPAWRRRQLRKTIEVSKFDPEHYIADYMMVDELEPTLLFSPGNVEDRHLSLEDQDALIRLPHRAYLPDSDIPACADLAGLLFASCYDLRCTLGERNVESAWTISRLCPSLSFLEVMPDPQTAIRVAYARSLAYPLYRHTRLSEQVLMDVQALCSSDSETLRLRILRTLLDVKNIFENSAVFRIFSDIFLTDYCVWIQHVDDSVLLDLAQEVQAANVPKESLPWDVGRLERFATQAATGDLPDDDEPVWEWESSYEKPARKVVPDYTPLDATSSFGAISDITSQQQSGDIRITANGGLESFDDLHLRPMSTRLLRSQSSGCGLAEVKNPEKCSSDDSGCESTSSASDATSLPTSSEAIEGSTLSNVPGQVPV